jgi:hypothetical protein
MDRKEIKDKLQQVHRDFSGFVASLPDSAFNYSPPGKWTAGQQVEHIIKTLAAINMGLSLPKFFLRLYVGRANRPSRSFEALAERYRQRLNSGGRAPARFIPRPVPATRKRELDERLVHTVQRLSGKLDSYSEFQLDYYILPHPLLGKLTIREMYYFAIFHAEHHHRHTKMNLPA